MKCQTQVWRDNHSHRCANDAKFLVTFKNGLTTRKCGVHVKPYERRSRGDSIQITRETV